jgi:isopentenyl-diphosphate delta-isomerase type 1
MGQNLNEVFDVVDAHDVVIGQETRGRVHALGLRHRSIHVFVFNRAGQLLLQLRSPTKDKFPNCWDTSCCGHVDSGETYDQAAWREMSEELGLTDPRAQVSDWKFLDKVDACATTGQEFVHVYRCVCEGPFSASPAEITELRWFSPTETEVLFMEQPDQVAPALPYLWRKLKPSS